MLAHGMKRRKRGEESDEEDEEWGVGYAEEVDEHRANLLRRLDMRTTPQAGTGLVNPWARAAGLARQQLSPAQRQQHLQQESTLVLEVDLRPQAGPWFTPLPKGRAAPPLAPSHSHQAATGPGQGPGTGQGPGPPASLRDLLASGGGGGSNESAAADATPLGRRLPAVLAGLKAAQEREAEALLTLPPPPPPSGSLLVQDAFRTAPVQQPFL
eukprot:XP_001696685.1 predicted protein [Chlamydomonas reinhardtii]